MNLMMNDSDRRRKTTLTLHPTSAWDPRKPASPPPSPLSPPPSFPFLSLFHLSPFPPFALPIPSTSTPSIGLLSHPREAGNNPPLPLADTPIALFFPSLPLRNPERQQQHRSSAHRCGRPNNKPRFNRSPGRPSLGLGRECLFTSFSPFVPSFVPFYSPLPILWSIPHVPMSPRRV